MLQNSIIRIAGASKGSLPSRSFSAMSASAQHYRDLEQKYVSQSSKKPAPVVV